MGRHSVFTKLYVLITFSSMMVYLSSTAAFNATSNVTTKNNNYYSNNLLTCDPGYGTRYVTKSYEYDNEIVEENCAKTIMNQTECKFASSTNQGFDQFIGQRGCSKQKTRSASESTELPAYRFWTVLRSN